MCNCVNFMFSPSGDFLRYRLRLFQRGQLTTHPVAAAFWKLQSDRARGVWKGYRLHAVESGKAGAVMVFEDDRLDVVRLAIEAIRLAEHMRAATVLPHAVSH